MVQTPHHILVATDFGEPAQHALDYALMLAKALGAKVTILHAFFVAPIVATDGLYVAMPVEQWFHDAEKTLASVVEAAKKEHPAVDGAVVSGEPREAIIAEIKERGADMLVIGTHARRGIARVFLGSVAERLARVSPVPVVLVHQ